MWKLGKKSRVSVRYAKPSETPNVEITHTAEGFMANGEPIDCGDMVLRCVNRIKQGEVTVKLLEDMDIATMIISKETKEAEVEAQLDAWTDLLASGKQVAFVVKKGALEFDGKVQYKNNNTMSREESIKHIAVVAGDDPIVSTTGKASRELFEIRERAGSGHGHDFLTVGSMGHSSSIALGLALQKPEKKVWVIDGDGAALMHMGAMAVIGSNKPSNKRRYSVSAMRRSFYAHFGGVD